MDVKRIDFHVHAKASKRFPFSLPYFLQTVDQATKTGLDAFVLTEHFHSPDFWTMYEVLCQTSTYMDGVLQLQNGFQILTGAELGVAEGCDLLLMGTLDQLGAFSQRLAASPTVPWPSR